MKSEKSRFCSRGSQENVPSESLLSEILVLNFRLQTHMYITSGVSYRNQLSEQFKIVAFINESKVLHLYKGLLNCSDNQLDWKRGILKNSM